MLSIVMGLERLLLFSPAIRGPCATHVTRMSVCFIQGKEDDLFRTMEKCGSSLYSSCEVLLIGFSLVALHSALISDLSTPPLRPINSLCNSK